MRTKSVLSFLITFLLLITCSKVNAQTIYFCEGVDDDGQPIKESSTFTIPDDGGYLYVLVRLPYAIDCTSIDFEIYRNGEYDNTISLDTEKDWTWFWKKINFYKSGRYTFYVDDCYEYELTSGKVTIEFE
jgi:hypothetical protein